MDFDDTPEEAQFRAEVRTFLAKNGSPKERDSGQLDRLPIAEATDLDAVRQWQRIKYEAGYAAITWAKEVGGLCGTAMQQVIYNQEESRFNVPSSLPFVITFGMCIPTLLAYASEAQKKFYTPLALRGEHIWCQLFSEPSAGSDVAGLRTRAERDGDRWIINGQKTWTSGAHFADWGVLIARSDATVPKHQGLTYFFLDMKSPGIEIRPIKHPLCTPAASGLHFRRSDPGISGGQ